MNKKEQGLVIAALEAAIGHLTTMVLMARDGDFHEWNSRGTVQTINELREFLDEVKNTDANFDG